MKFSIAVIRLMTLLLISAQLQSQRKKPNSFLHFHAYPVIPSASKVSYVLPQIRPASTVVIPGSFRSCQRELKLATQRLDDTIVTLQNMQNDLEVLKVTSQSLARTMVTIWILTTTQLQDSVTRSAEISQLLSASNNNIVALKNQLNDTQTDLAATKAKVANLTTELRASWSPVSIGKIPNSCADLQLIGNKISGLYSILGNKSIDIVYCDFTKYSNDTEFQKFIGSAGVKSAPTYFYVQKNNSFSSIDVPIPFEIERVNIGGAMDTTNGTFTTLKSGIYYFSFTGLAEFPASNEFEHLEVRLFLNGISIGAGHTSKASATKYQFSQLTLQSTLNLREGDHIWLQITAMSDGVFLYDAHDVHHTHFSGFILEEDFS